MKKGFRALFPATLLAVGVALLPSASFAADDGGLKTLRGASVAAKSMETGDAMKKAFTGPVFDRDSTEQPPLVNHAVDDYPVTLKVNKCLDCHSWENAKREKATKVSQTHFEDANGKKLSHVSARRYFCLQCHVPQLEAKPLVKNTYQRGMK